MNRLNFSACLLLGLLSFASASHAQSLVVSNFGSWNGSDATVLGFGTGPVAIETFGQTFKAPTANLKLDSFTFWAKDGSGSRLINFNGYLYEWDGNSATGSQLNTVTSSHTIANGSGFTAYTLSFGGILLDASKTYVAFAEGSGSFLFSSYANFARSGDSYADGQFVAYNNGGNLSAITSTWGVPALTAGTDLIFTANYTQAEAPAPAPQITPVPEPSTYALIGSGSLLALAALRRRRKQA